MFRDDMPPKLFRDLYEIEIAKEIAEVASLVVANHPTHFLVGNIGKFLLEAVIICTLANFIIGRSDIWDLLLAVAALFTFDLLFLPSWQQHLINIEVARGDFPYLNHLTYLKSKNNVPTR